MVKIIPQTYPLASKDPALNSITVKIQAILEHKYCPDHPGSMTTIVIISEKKEFKPSINTYCFRKFRTELESLAANIEQS